jgi:hypothetical protein
MGAPFPGRPSLCFCFLRIVPLSQYHTQHVRTCLDTASLRHHPSPSSQLVPPSGGRGYGQCGRRRNTRWGLYQGLLSGDGSSSPRARRARLFGVPDNTPGIGEVDARGYPGMPGASAQSAAAQGRAASGVKSPSAVGRSSRIADGPSGKSAVGSVPSTGTSFPIVTAARVHVDGPVHDSDNAGESLAKRRKCDANSLQPVPLLVPSRQSV